MSSKSRQAACPSSLGCNTKKTNTSLPLGCNNTIKVFVSFLLSLSVLPWHVSTIGNFKCVITRVHKKDLHQNGRSYIITIGTRCWCSLCSDAGIEVQWWGFKPWADSLQARINPAPHYMPPLCTPPLIGHIRASLMHYIIWAYYNITCPVMQPILGPASLPCGYRWWKDTQNDVKIFWGS